MSTATELPVNALVDTAREHAKQAARYWLHRAAAQRASQLLAPSLPGGTAVP